MTAKILGATSGIAMPTLLSKIKLTPLSWGLVFLPFSNLFPIISFAGQSYGTLRVVKGEVKILPKSSMVEKRAKLGKKVFPGDEIITGKDSRAKVIMMDKNEINLSPNSRIKIQKYVNDPEMEEKAVLLNLIYGKIRNKVKIKYNKEGDSFRVRTRTAVAGVRGTDFLASFNPSTDNTQVVTFKGQVEFGKGVNAAGIIKPVLIRPGYISSCGSNMKPSPPKIMNPQKLARAEMESQVRPPDPSKVKPRTPANETKNKKSQPKSSPVFEKEDLPSDCVDCANSPVNPLALPPPEPPTKAKGTCPTCKVIEDGNTNVRINLVPTQ